MAMAKKPSSLNASFDPKTANADSIHKVVDLMLKMAGCPACGRLSVLKVEFATNPSDAKIPGVISVQSAE